MVFSPQARLRHPRLSVAYREAHGRPRHHQIVLKDSGGDVQGNNLNVNNSNGNSNHWYVH